MSLYFWVQAEEEELFSEEPYGPPFVQKEEIKGEESKERGVAESRKPQGDIWVAPLSPRQPFDRYPSGIPFEERQDLAREKQVLTGKVWTLPMLIDEALQRNPLTRVAWEEARAAASGVKVAESAYYPTLTATTSFQGAIQSNPVFQGGSPQVSYIGATPGFQLQYLLFDFGGREASVGSARLALLADNFAFNESLQQLVLEVMTNYYTIYGAKKQVKNAEVAWRLAQKTLEYVEIRQRTGLGTSTDVGQARQAVAQSVFNLEKVRGDLREAEVKLTASLGLPADVSMKTAPPRQPVALDWLEEKVDVLVDRALRQRPDLAQAYARWQSQRAVAQEEEAAIWPRIDVNFSTQNTFFEATERVNGANISQSNNFGNLIGQLTFTWDFFDGGNVWNQARKAEALAASARAELVNTELEAIAEVIIDFVSFKTSAKEVGAGEALVEASQLNFQSMEIAYRSGLKNLLEMLTAQEDLTSAQASLAQAQTDLYIAAVTLAYSTGELRPHERGKGVSLSRGGRR